MHPILSCCFLLLSLSLLLKVSGDFSKGQVNPRFKAGWALVARLIYLDEDLAGNVSAEHDRLGAPLDL